MASWSLEAQLIGSFAWECFVGVGQLEFPVGGAWLGWLVGGSSWPVGVRVGLGWLNRGCDLFVGVGLGWLGCSAEIALLELGLIGVWSWV